MGQETILTGYLYFVEQIPFLLGKYPKLNKNELNGKYYITGELDIVDEFDKYWETYKIEIHCSDLYPKRFPNLKEVGGKLPKIADWHIYEDTNNCCVKILPEEILICLNGITLEDYISKQVMPYLFNQTHRRVEGFYVNGEYGHGYYGLYEFYSDELKTNDINLIIKYLLFIANNRKPDRTSDCFCCSGRKYRYCHRQALNKLSLLGKDILEYHAHEFYLAIEKSKIAKTQ